jgi:hypothetical protein
VPVEIPGKEFMLDVGVIFFPGNLTTGFVSGLSQI